MRLAFMSCNIPGERVGDTGQVGDLMEIGYARVSTEKQDMR